MCKILGNKRKKKNVKVLTKKNQMSKLEEAQIFFTTL